MSNTQKTLIGTIPIPEMQQEVDNLINETKSNYPAIECLTLFDDPEMRSEMILDSSNKIISYRKEDGTKVENVGIETTNINTNKLTLTEDGMKEFQQVLKDSGFRPGGNGDWSDYISNDGDNPLTLPIPKCAAVNLITDFNLRNLSKEGRDDAVEGVNYNIPIDLEYWDYLGNYFKKPVCISGQGNSTMNYAKKNIAIDFFDSSQYNSKGKLGKGDALGIRFGNWVPCDSYHMKANVTESTRFINNLSYKFYDSIVKTRGILKDYSWKTGEVDLSQIGTTTISKSLASNSWDDGAKCFPDGFPVIIYQNGEFWGIFVFSIKKARQNYHLKKDVSENIHLDGLLDDEIIFMANGNVDWAMFCSKKVNWDGFLDGIEVRNPKDLYCVDVSYSYLQLDPVSDAVEIAAVVHRGHYTNCTVDMSSATDIQIREIYGDNPPAYLHNMTDDVYYRIIETPTGSCSKYNADTNNHELIDSTMSCYKPSDANHVRTNEVKHYIKDLSRVMTTVNSAEQVYLESEKTAEDLAALKEVFETYFDVDNLIDYMIHGDITDNWDGFRGKNWQWFTYNGVKWYCGLYDNDLTFGYYWVSNNIRVPQNGHTCQGSASAPAHTLLFNRYILTYYTTELEARYKELRDKHIIDADSITKILSDSIDCIPKETYKMEWSKWSSVLPIDNVYRIHTWLTEKIRLMDIVYNYN